MLTFAANPAASDWSHAILMGRTPEVIPLNREARWHYCYCYPLTNFSPRDILVCVGGLPVKYGKRFAGFGYSPCLPSRWDQGSRRSTKITEAVGEPA